MGARVKLFELHRIEDESGVSGTGIVAQGVEFDDGRVSFRWLTPKRSTVIFDSMEELEFIHGHQGKTKVVYLSMTQGVAERWAIVDFLRHVPDRVVDDWGMNATSEIEKHVKVGNASQGRKFWDR